MTKYSDEEKTPVIEIVQGRSYRVLRTILAATPPPEGQEDTSPAEWRPMQVDDIVTDAQLAELNCDIAFLLRSESLEELKYVGVN